MLENMREIGRVKQVQVQRTGLKPGDRLRTYYDPSPLLVVDQALVSAEGVIGVTDDGERVLDVHHMQHPQTRNSGGKNGVSIGFTSHYDAMRTRLNPRLADGCAGENILIEAERSFALADLGGEVALQSAATGEVLYLARLKVAAPCIEFSQYAANDGMPMAGRALKETLQFLDEGRRGFYATATNQHEPVSIRAGDRVFVAVAGQEDW